MQLYTGIKERYIYSLPTLLNFLLYTVICNICIYIFFPINVQAVFVFLSCCSFSLSYTPSICNLIYLSRGFPVAQLWVLWGCALERTSIWATWASIPDILQKGPRWSIFVKRHPHGKHVKQYFIVFLVPKL